MTRPRVGDRVVIQSPMWGIVEVEVLEVYNDEMLVRDDEDPDACGEFWCPTSWIQEHNGGETDGHH